MLESGFITAALAFVGILPAREVHRDIPEFDLAPLPVDPVVRPTTTRSPRPDVAAVPVEPQGITRLNAIEREPNAFEREITRLHLVPANTAAFVGWLREINEFGEMPKRRLLSLYAEFCENAFEPVSTGRLMRQLGECGVVKRRLAPRVVHGKYHSPTVYRVLPVQMRRAAAA